MFSPSKSIAFIGVCSVLWPVGAIVFHFSENITLFSSIPVALGWAYLIYAICFWPIKKLFLNYFLLLIGLFSILLSAIYSGGGDLLRPIKTFMAPALFFLILCITQTVRNAKLKRFSFEDAEVLVFNVALGVSFFGFIELMFRYYFSGAGDTWYGYLESAGFAGVKYLQHGYMDWGFIFQGQRPLGLYGDQHTAPLVGVLCAYYFLLTERKIRFWLAIAAIIFTFRWTYFIFVPILIFISSKYSRNLIVNFSLSLLLIPFLIYFYNFIANDDSGVVLLLHFFEGENIFKLSWLDLMFGIGYTGNLETDLGFLEIFIFKYILFFGALGVVYLSLLTFLPWYVYYLLKSTSRGRRNFNSMGLLINYKEYVFLPLVPIIGTLHYNSFFTPTTAFLYSLLLVYGLMKNRSLTYKCREIKDVSKIGAPLLGRLSRINDSAQI